jgi:DNA-binding IscR family transcriptional regulator
MEPSDITVGYILRITEGNLSSIACLENNVNQCDMADTCKTLFVWKELNKVIADYLDSVTLQDILNKYPKNEFFDYVI